MQRVSLNSITAESYGPEPRAARAPEIKPVYARYGWESRGVVYLYRSRCILELTGPVSESTHLCCSTNVRNRVKAAYAASPGAKYKLAV